jgi:hypothetical protein
MPTSYGVSLFTSLRHPCPMVIIRTRQMCRSTSLPNNRMASRLQARCLPGISRTIQQAPWMVFHSQAQARGLIQRASCRIRAAMWTTVSLSRTYRQDPRHTALNRSMRLHCSSLDPRHTLNRSTRPPCSSLSPCSKLIGIQLLTTTGSLT